MRHAKKPAFSDFTTDADRPPTVRCRLLKGTVLEGAVNLAGVVNQRVREFWRVGHGLRVGKRLSNTDPVSRLQTESRTAAAQGWQQSSQTLYTVRDLQREAKNAGDSRARRFA